MDIEGNVSAAGWIMQRASRSGFAKTALRASALTALGLIIALAVLLPSAPAETQTAPTDATATTTATGTATATATPTPTATPDPDATATPTPTPTATPDPDATATPTATVTATATPTVPPANADYDVDNDGLIEIRTLAQLNAVRHDLDGDGKQGSVSAANWATYTTAFLNAASDMGCKLTDHDSDAATPQQATCTGYELMQDLDFDTDGDGDVDASDTGSYPNWTPIGDATNSFNATFKGNGNDAIATISNLTISGGSSTTEVGLFGATGSNARIEGVGLVDVNVNMTTSSGNANIGALAGSNAGKVIACYSTGAITVTAGAGSYAGGLVGYNAGTGAAIAASFSRATVSMSIHAAATGSMDIYAGGLVGQNARLGTLTATYAAGAVKGKGGSGSYVGGLVGDNLGTITASYSIAPVTAAGITPTATASNKPGVGGLIGYNDPSATVTASYWDYIASGIDDDSDNGAMPEGKSTYDLLSPISAAGIYADWDDLTIDGANDVDPWNFGGDARERHPQLTYGGHATTALSGNQHFSAIGVSYYRYTSGYRGHPREGITLVSNRGGAGGARLSNWIWESSTDGIDWTTLVPLPGKSRRTLSGAGSTYRFVPRSEHIGKYIRAKMQLTTGGHAYTTYTRVVGKVKAPTNAPELSFAGGHNWPFVDREVTVASLPSGAKGLWYRCDSNSASPPSAGCELVGSRPSYIPGTADLGHYLYAYIYYKNADGAWMRSATGFTPQKVIGERISQWR